MPEVAKLNEAQKKEKRPRHRSPNYPSISLREAVAKIEDVYREDGLAPSLKTAALKHMGFEKAHSNAGRALSALKSFGLVEESGDRIKLTQRALNIVARPESDTQRLNALREAALSPPIYRELVREYRSSGLPSDTTLKADLIAERKFNPNAVDGFLLDFRGTLDFTGLSQLDVVESDLGGKEDVLAPEQQAPATRQSAVVGPPLVPAVPLVSKSEKPALSLLNQTLPVSISRNLRVDIQVRGDELRREDLERIKSQFTRWIEGLAEAFEE